LCKTETDDGAMWPKHVAEFIWKNGLSGNLTIYCEASRRLHFVCVYQVLVNAEGYSRTIIFYEVTIITTKPNIRHVTNP
jgi:hypothetical protein